MVTQSGIGFSRFHALRDNASCHVVRFYHYVFDTIVPSCLSATWADFTFHDSCLLRDREIRCDFILRYCEKVMRKVAVILRITEDMGFTNPLS